MLRAPRGFTSRKTVSRGTVTGFTFRSADIHHPRLPVTRTDPSLPSGNIIVATVCRAPRDFTSWPKDADHVRRGMPLTDLRTLTGESVGGRDVAPVCGTYLRHEVLHLGVCMCFASTRSCDSKARSLRTPRSVTFPRENIHHSIQFMRRAKSPKGFAFIITSRSSGTTIGFARIPNTHPWELVFGTIPRGFAFESIGRFLRTSRMEAPRIPNIQHSLVCVTLTEASLPPCDIKIAGGRWTSRVLTGWIDKIDHRWKSVLLTIAPLRPWLSKDSRRRCASLRITESVDDVHHSRKGMFLTANALLVRKPERTGCRYTSRFLTKRDNQILHSRLFVRATEPRCLCPVVCGSRTHLAGGHCTLQTFSRENASA